MQVLMGFLGDEMTQSMLPLMINFEAKSISKQFPALKETMEKRCVFCALLCSGGINLIYLLQCCVFGRAFAFVVTALAYVL